MKWNAEKRRTGNCFRFTDLIYKNTFLVKNVSMEDSQKLVVRPEKNAIRQ